MLAKVLAGAAAVDAPIWGVIKYLDSRFDKKADKDSVKMAFEKIDTELTLHRGYFKDVFKTIEANEKSSEARHRELMMHLLEKR